MRAVGVWPLTQVRPAPGFAGRIARAFIDSKLTPLVIVTSIFLGAAAIYLLPREEQRIRLLKAHRAPDEAERTEG